MSGQELKIKLKEQSAFLTKNVKLDFNQVNMIFNIRNPLIFEAPAFLTVRVKKYIENEKRLHVEILNYNAGDIEFPDEQVQLESTLSQIEKVSFPTISLDCLSIIARSTQPITILPPKPEPSREETPRQPEIQIYNESFFIPIKDITFLDGRVTFSKKIQELQKKVKFQIPNNNIIKQYDAVKNYFAKVLREKIQVNPTIEIVDGNITSIKATSRQIERIDKTLIEEVKFKFVNVARKKEYLGDKQIFTMSEYFKTFADKDFEEQPFFENENILFETILQKSNPKHYKHLRFLSSKHRQDLQRLCIVHNPFSFVFLLSGVDNFHIVWETLDTQEATYIWTYPNDINRLKEFLTHTDEAIMLIRRENKNEYIRQNEENFKRVFHDYTDKQNGFRKWKDSIETIVT